MNRQQGAMQKPCRDRGCSNQHARISREQSSEDRRTKNEKTGGEAQELIQCAGESLMSVQLERDQTRYGRGTERTENPGAHRHGGSMFKNTQHVEEEVGPAEVHDQQNGRKNCSSDGRDPHGCTRKIDMMKDDRSASDYRRHSGQSPE